MNMLSLLRRRLCCCFASTPGPRLRLMAFWIKCVFVYFFPPGLVQHDVEQRLRGRGSVTLTHRLTHSEPNVQKTDKSSKKCPCVTPWRHCALTQVEEGTVRQSPACWRPPGSTTYGNPSGAWPSLSPATAAGALSPSSKLWDGRWCFCSWREILAAQI